MIGLIFQLMGFDPPRVPPGRNVVLVRSGDGVAIRTPWNVEFDLVQRLTMNEKKSDNRNDLVNWEGGGIGILPKTTSEDKSLSERLTTTFQNPQDDMAPVFVQYGYIGGNHGNSRLRVVTATGHGKSSADLYSMWSDSANPPHRFHLVAVPNADTLWMIGENLGSEVDWNFSPVLAGPVLNHISGAANTGSITVARQASGQMWPAVRHRWKAILLDGVTKVWRDGIFRCTFVDVVNDYDILDSHKTLELLASHPGREIKFRDPAIPGAYRITQRHRFHENGSDSLLYSFETLIPGNLAYGGYMGAVQQAAVTRPLGGSSWRYIPGVSPFEIANVRYNLSQVGGQQISTIPAGFSIGREKWSHAASPPDRFLDYVKTWLGARSYGMMVGFDPLYERGKAASLARGTVSTLLISQSSKAYPKFVSEGGSEFGASIPAGIKLKALAYRLPINFGSHRDLLVGEWYESGEPGVFNVNVDTFGPRTTTVNLPIWWEGKKVSVIRGALTAAKEVPPGGQLPIFAEEATSGTLKIQ